MKLFVSLTLVNLLVVLCNNQASAACTIDKSVNGTGRVVFGFSQSPLSVLAQFSSLKSPAAILEKLDSPSNPVKVAADALTTAVKAAARLIPFAKIPTCTFLWSTSELYCENVPTSILAPFCGNNSLIDTITKPIKFPLPQAQEASLPCENPQPWGLSKIGAPAVWARNETGQGVVVANLDTGVRRNHTELKDNHRSSFGWFDATPTKFSTPTDDAGHGTHTMGTIAGKTVGVAPGSQWIACRGCDSTGCEDLALKLCLEWLYCPDRVNGKATLNCTTAPDVINHSWGGGIGNTKSNAILKLMKEAGIINFFSSGNSGPLCFSVKSPADGNGTDLGIISVGATACNDNIGAYSSVGPSQAADNMGGLGNEIVAPGSNVWSAWGTNDTAYKLETGTSMASPHATGAAAVLLSADPTLDFDGIRNALRNTAYKNPGVNSPLCGGSTPASTEPWPNQVYGYGRIDLEAALNYVLSEEA